MAWDVKWSELKQRLAACVTERHRREPRAVWKRQEIGRLVLIELAKLGFDCISTVFRLDFDWISLDRLTDIKHALLVTYRLIRAGGRTWRIDPDHCLETEECDSEPAGSASCDLK